MRVSEPKKRTWSSPNGTKSHSYVISYRNAAGKRVREQFPRKADALARKEELMRSEEPASAKKMQSITVDEAATAWIDRCRQNRPEHPPLEEATVSRYSGMYRNHIAPRIKDRSIEGFGHADAYKFATDLLTTCSRAQAEKVMQAARSIFDVGGPGLAYWENPFLHVDIAKWKRDEADLVMPTIEEVARMREAADRLAVWPKMEQIARAWRRYRPMLYLLSSTGFRMSEIRGLAWPNLLWDQNAIQISQRAEEKGVLGPPKSAAGRRKVHVPANVMEMLATWRLSCPETRDDIPAIRHADNWTPERCLVFPTETGRVQSLSNLAKRWWTPMMREAGMFDPETEACMFDRHSLRHFRASQLIKSGKSVKEVQRELGHESPEVTLKIYAKLWDGQDDRLRRSEEAEALSSEIDNHRTSKAA